jgi:hypothetical protein
MNLHPSDDRRTSKPDEILDELWVYQPWAD